jgi:hypothetical protein
MTDKISRPVSIWITQILLIVFIAVFSIGIFLMLDMSMKIFNSSDKTAITGIVVAFGYNLLMVFVMSMAFWGLVERKSYGRWLSVGLFSLFFVASLLSKFSTSKGVPFKYYEYENKTQMMYGTGAQVFLYALFLALIITLVKSNAVNDFFDSQKTQKSEENLQIPD